MKRNTIQSVATRLSAEQDKNLEKTKNLTRTELNLMGDVSSYADELYRAMEGNGVETMQGSVRARMSQLKTLLKQMQDDHEDMASMAKALDKSLGQARKAIKDLGLKTDVIRDEEETLDLWKTLESKSQRKIISDLANAIKQLS